MKRGARSDRMFGPKAHTQSQRMGPKRQGQGGKFQRDAFRLNYCTSCPFRQPSRGVCACGHGSSTPLPALLRAIQSCRWIVHRCAYRMQSTAPPVRKHNSGSALGRGLSAIGTKGWDADNWQGRSPRRATLMRTSFTTSRRRGLRFAIGRRGPVGTLGRSYRAVCGTKTRTGWFVEWLDYRRVSSFDRLSKAGDTSICLHSSHRSLTCIADQNERKTRSRCSNPRAGTPRGRPAARQGRREGAVGRDLISLNPSDHRRSAAACTYVGQASVCIVNGL